MSSVNGENLAQQEAELLEQCRHFASPACLWLK